MIRKFDFLIIGGGVAGMSYALKVANSGKGKVALVCKTTMRWKSSHSITWVKK